MSDTTPTPRMSLKLSDIQAFYAGLVVLFLCTGFFYNLIFLSLFGVRVELFFTLQDYLSSSIEKVYLILIAVLIASGSSHVVRYLLRRKERQRYHQIILTVIYLLPLPLAGIGTYLLVGHNPFGYYLLALTVYISIDFLLFKLVFKADHHSYERFFFLTVLLLYFLVLASAILVDRDVINQEPINALKTYRVHFDPHLTVDQHALVLLEANSTYYFFYDKEKKKALIVPRTMVGYLEKR